MADYPLFRNDRAKPVGRREATYPNRKAVKAAEARDGMKGVASDVGFATKGKHYAGRQFPGHCC